MNHENDAFREIGIALAKHFDSLYYIDIKTGNYEECIHMKQLDEFNIPVKGKDFFSDAQDNAYKCVHPYDLDLVISIHDKKTMLKNLSVNPSYSTVYRLLINDQVNHVRHIEIMCEDKRHIICCLENIEDEIQQKKAQKKDLQSAKRKAKLDDLTGIRNKNAFRETAEMLDIQIKSRDINTPFGIVMCDVNDLKLINDSRGHSFGDEVIQRTSRLICDIFKHSPVYRVGGDEFVVMLVGSDYENREELHKLLLDESIANKLSRSGPVVASGIAVFESDIDFSFDSVYERADKLMYENKAELKSTAVKKDFENLRTINTPIPDDRKRQLDRMFGALLTVSDGGYVFLTDMKYDFSRWSLSLIDDFNMDSEYMYHPESIWVEYIHPDDLEKYHEAMDAVLCPAAEFRPIFYRAKRADGAYVPLTVRGFILNDRDGNPEYFGGIIIPQ